MSTLHYLVYVSRACQALEAPVLAGLEARAAAFNQGAGVTGVLAHLGGCFYQWLEGPPESVAAVMNRVRADSMHHTVLVLEEGPVPDRAFAGWSMVAEGFGEASDAGVQALEQWLRGHGSPHSAGPARFMDLTRRFLDNQRQA